MANHKGYHNMNTDTEWELNLGDKLQIFHQSHKVSQSLLYLILFV